VALIITTWWWGKKYPAHYVERLSAGVLRHLNEPHRFICMVDDLLSRPRIPGVNYVQILDHDLVKEKGCFARLRMFDPHWQFLRDFRKGDRIVCIDLDCVITGALDPLFYRPEPFLILQGANAANPNPMNGSLMMLRAGEHADVWSDFSVEKASRVPFHDFPDDQGWIWHKIPDAAGWKAGPQSQVFAFKKPGWPIGDDLPQGARAVFFPGARDPQHFTHLPWVQEHWRA
jgi:hypothetical protein